MAQNVGELSIAITGDNSSLTSAIESSVGGLNALSLGAGVAVGALAAVGVAAVGTAVALGKIAVESVKLGMEFDSTMSEVKAITGSTNEEMLQLNETAKQLGATTSFSAKQAAEGMTFLGMAGFDTNEIISAMPGLLDLAAASGTDLALTADIVSDALSAFGMSAEETGRFADVLAATTSSANTTVQLLGESFKFAAPIAGTLGFSIEDVSAALGIMADASIKASQAGTTMRTLMSEIGVEAGKTENKFSELGVALLDSEGEMRGLGDILTDLQKSFSTMSEAQKVSTAESLVGKNAMSGFLAVMNDTDGSLQGLTETLENSAGTASKMSNEMLDNLAGDFKLIGSAIDGLKLQISDGLTPYVRDLAGVFSDILPFISEFIDLGLIYLQDTIAQMTPAFNDMIAVLEEELLPVFQDLFNWAKDNLPAIQQFFVRTFEESTEIVKVAARLIGEIWERFGGNLLNYTDIQMSGLADIFESSLFLIKENFNFFLAIMDGDSKKASESLKLIFSEMWDILKTTFDTALKTIAELVLTYFEEIATNLGESADEMRNFLVASWNNMIDDTKTAVEVLLFEIKNFDKLALEYFSGLKDEAIELIGDMWESVKKTFNDSVELIGETLQDFYGLIEGWFLKTAEDAITWGSEIVNGLIKGIGDMAGSLGGFLGDFVKDNVIDPVKNMLDIHSPSRVFKEIGNFVVEGMDLGISENSEKVMKTMESFSAKLINTAKMTVEKVNGIISVTGGGSSGGGSFDTIDAINAITTTMDDTTRVTDPFANGNFNRGGQVNGNQAFGWDPITNRWTSSTDPDITSRLEVTPGGEKVADTEEFRQAQRSLVNTPKRVSEFDQSVRDLNRARIDEEKSRKRRGIPDPDSVIQPEQTGTTIINNFTSPRPLSQKEMTDKINQMNRELAFTM